MTWYASTNRQRFTGGAGWLASVYPGGGILGSAVPSTGSNGHASPLFNDITLPGEANDEFAWAITVAPSGGTFIPYEDGSFYYLGPSTTFTYEGFKNYVSYGTAVVTINTGANFTGASALDELGATGTFVVAGAGLSFTGASALEDLGASGTFEIAPAGLSFTGAAALENLGASGTFEIAPAGLSFTGAAALQDLGATGSFIANTGPVTPGTIVTTTTSTRHSLKLLVPASQTPVNLAEAKTQLRVDTVDDDLLIESYIFAATEAAEQLLGRAIMPQTWQLTHDSFPGLFELTRTRVLGVVSITYVDDTGTTQTLPASSYALDNADDYGFAYVVPALGLDWPASATQMNAVIVTYQAGYSNAAEVPRGVKAWVLLAVRAMYDGCKDGDTVTVGTLGPADRLLDGARIYSL